MENEIKLIRALKNRDGKETHKEWGVIYQNQRRQMKDTVKITNYMQTSTAEERPMTRVKDMGQKIAMHMH